MLTQMDCSLNVTVLDIFSRQKNPIKHCATSLDTHTHVCVHPCNIFQYIMSKFRLSRCFGNIK